MSQTTTDLTVASANAMVAAEWSPQKVELVARTIAKGATPDELALFAGICQRTGLDPFKRQIYAIKRWDSKEKREVMQTQVSVDGLRLIAQRSGMYAGQTMPEYCADDGRWVDVWLQKTPPAAARVGVLRKDFTAPMFAVATYEEYVQTNREGKPNAMWGKMPAVMLAKCAESLALRKAFPDDAAGLYTAEEMGQSFQGEHLEHVDAVEPIVVLRESWKLIVAVLGKEAGNARCADLLAASFGADADVNSLTDDQKIEFAAALTVEFARLSDAPSSDEPELAEFEEVTVTVDDDPLGGMDSPRIQIPVTGRKGDPYTITVFNDGSWNCSCPAYTADCHHVTDIRRPYPGGVGYLWPGDADYENAPPSDAAVPETPADVSTHTPETGLLAYAKQLGIRDTDAMMEILKVPGGPEDMPACIAALDGLAASRRAAAEEAGEAA
jgi:phage recombination protein Bet